MDINHVVGVLKLSRVFEGLGDADLKKIAAGCSEQAFPMGTTIIEENDSPKNVLYFIKSGELTISASHVGEDGPSISDESLITTLGPGDAFGEIAIVDQQPHSANVRAISDCFVYLLSGNLLDALCDQEPHIGYVIYKNLARLICRRLRLSNFTTKHFWKDED